MRVSTLLTCSSLVLASAIPASAQTSYVEIPDSVVDSIGAVLPEQSNAGAAYVSEIYSPNLEVTEACEVQLTFVWEGAGYRNTLGYFTYSEETNGTVSILSSNLVFPNLSFPSAGTMSTGDTAWLLDGSGAIRTFQPGEKIGFFLIADGWSREPIVSNWDYDNIQIPSSSPAQNAQFGRGCYTSLNKLNPEYLTGAPEKARHLAMLWFPGTEGFLDGEPYLVSGFEDLNRMNGSDDDFNDAVFIVRSTPSEAIDNTPAFVFNDGDPDGDDVFGTDDHYPHDPDRAVVIRTPSSGWNIVALEDNYPNRGDADYNDAVVAYEYRFVTNAAGLVTDLLCTYHLLARGAVYDHMFGLNLPKITSEVGGTVKIERFLSRQNPIHELVPERPIGELVGPGGCRVRDIFPSTMNALPSSSGPFTNTQSETPDRDAASARVSFSFDPPIAPALLGNVPYDLYFSVLHDDEEWDIHLPGAKAFEDRPGFLPIETGNQAFLDDGGYPWMIEVPTSWRYPLEMVHVATAYPEFSTWSSSFGTSGNSWYLTGSGFGGQLSSEPSSFTPVREWTLELPNP